VAEAQSYGLGRVCNRIFGFAFCSLAALVTYGIATLLWIFTLRFWPLTIAYAAQALSIVVVISLGVAVFGEALSTIQYCGIAIILTGLIVLSVG
jgi:drug/metabolite transporter (DMT)-like permease